MTTDQIQDVAHIVHTALVIARTSREVQTNPDSEFTGTESRGIRYLGSKIDKFTFSDGVDGVPFAVQKLIDLAGLDGGDVLHNHIKNALSQRDLLAEPCALRTYFNDPTDLERSKARFVEFCENMFSDVYDDDCSKPELTAMQAARWILRYMQDNDHLHPDFFAISAMCEIYESTATDFIKRLDAMPTIEIEPVIPVNSQIEFD